MQRHISYGLLRVSPKNVMLRKLGGDFLLFCGAIEISKKGGVQQQAQHRLTTIHISSGTASNSVASQVWEKTFRGCFMLRGVESIG